MKITNRNFKRHHQPRIVEVAIYDRRSTRTHPHSPLRIAEVRRRLCPDCHGTGNESPGASANFTFYSDSGPANGESERPGLERLIAAAMLRRVNVVVCRRPDRLARDQKQFNRLVREFKRAGINVIFLDASPLHEGPR